MHAGNTRRCGDCAAAVHISCRADCTRSGATPSFLLGASAETQGGHMATTRPFRFTAALLAAPSAVAWAESSRRIEALGFDALAVGDHLQPNYLAPTAAMMAAAAATTTLRVTVVYDNDFRHPALLAKEAATLDVLGDGRLDF